MASGSVSPSFKDKVISFFTGNNKDKNKDQSNSDINHGNKDSSSRKEREESRNKIRSKSTARYLESEIRQIIESDKSRKQVLNYCNQTSPVSFQKEFSSSDYGKVERFDSGTYAEVFRGRSERNNAVVIFKVIRSIPKSLPKKVREISFSGSENYDDVLNEIIIIDQLSQLHETNGLNSAKCFPRVHKIKVVRGKIPSHFLNETDPKPTTPLRKEPFADLPNAPLEYVVIEMSDGGTPLWKAIKESLVDPYQLLSITKQVTFALAVAETAFEFEHRDLHISNILVKPTHSEYNQFIINGQHYHVESCGFKVCLIDTTFSRYRTVTKRVCFKDMTDTLRPRSGRSKNSLQDLIYTRMVEESGNDWKSFWPKTNVFWLYYLYKTVLKSKIVKKAETPHVANSLSDILKSLPKCKSAAQVAEEIGES